jgi:NAD(P)H-flavin reductase
VSAAAAGAADRTLAPFGRRRAALTAVEQLGAYRMLWAEDSAGPPDPRAGQFYMLAAADGWGAGRDERPYLPRAFSFARVLPSRGTEGATLGFLLDEVGPGTERLGRLAVGEELWLAGPFGRGFSAAGEHRPLLAGGGIGVAPILALADELGPRAPVLLGFRTAAHAEARALFASEQVALATDDGSAGRRALVTELLEEEIRAGGSAPVRACGPPPMLEAVRRLCVGEGVPAELALESGMACGYGACYGCVVPTDEGYLRLCVEGPVVEADRLATAALAFEPGA